MTAPAGGPEAASAAQTLAPALREAFVAEAHEVLEQMERGLLALEANQDDSEALHRVFRAAHTLKGNGAAAGLGAVARFTHELESLLEELRGGRLVVTGALLRPMVQFARLNLARPPYVARGPFDMIFCRNTLIYFDRAMKARVVAALQERVAARGRLFVGHAESLNGLTTGMRMVRASVYEPAR